MENVIQYIRQHVSNPLFDVTRWETKVPGSEDAIEIAFDKQSNASAILITTIIISTANTTTNVDLVESYSLEKIFTISDNGKNIVPIQLNHVFLTNKIKLVSTEKSIGITVGYQVIFQRANVIG